MHETLNLVVDFVSSSQNSTPQTGDLSLPLCLAAVALILCICAVFFLMKDNLSFLKRTINGSHTKKQNALTLTKNKTAFAIVAFLFAVLLIYLLFTIGHAFAESEGSLTPDTNKITATVTDDGSISFSECNLTNYSNASYIVSSSSVNVSEEAKSVTTLSNSNFKINGFGGLLFEGAPNGSTYSTENLKPLPGNESTKLSFNLENLDKNSALALCGKSVFEITLTQEELFKAGANVDDTTHGTITGIPIENIAYGTPYVADATNNKITIGEGASAQTITFIQSSGYKLDKWLIGTTEVKSGIITDNTIFTASTIPDEKWISFKNVGGYDYYPVFKDNEVPEGVTFYGKDKQTSYTSMNVNIEYAKVNGDTPIQTVRSVNNVSYNTVYSSIDSGTYPLIKEVDTSTPWYAENINTDETVECLWTDASMPIGNVEPQIFGVGITSIWKTYNPGKEADAFGNMYGLFLSCIAYDKDKVYGWLSMQGNSSYNWRDDDDISLCILVSRIF